MRTPPRPKTVLVERESPSPAPVAPAGIEARPGWRSAALGQWTDAHPSAARCIEHAASGQLLLIRWKGEGKGKAVVSRVANLSLPSASRLRFRTYSYADREVKLALGFFTGEGRAYYETPKVDVPSKKWADHAFDLGMSYFKCAASDGKTPSPRGEPDQGKERAVWVYDGGAGALYLDALVLPGQ